MENLAYFFTVSNRRIMWCFLFYFLFITLTLLPEILFFFFSRLDFHRTLCRALRIFPRYRKSSKLYLNRKRKAKLEARLEDFFLDAYKSRCSFVLSQVKVKALTIVCYMKINHVTFTVKDVTRIHTPFSSMCSFLALSCRNWFKLTLQ